MDLYGRYKRLRLIHKGLRLTHKGLRLTHKGLRLIHKGLRLIHKGLRLIHKRSYLSYNSTFSKTILLLKKFQYSDFLKKKAYLGKFYHFWDKIQKIDLSLCYSPPKSV